MIATIPWYSTAFYVLSGSIGMSLIMTRERKYAVIGILIFMFAFASIIFNWI